MTSKNIKKKTGPVVAAGSPPKNRVENVRQRAGEHSDPSFSTTLARGLQVLSGFRPGDQALSNGEIAARTGLTRPTVSRLTFTLVELGFLRRDGAGHYRLGTRVLGIAYPLLASMRIRQLARPLMREFASQAIGTVSLAMPVGRDFIYLETVRGSDGVAHMPDVGFSAPLANTAAGRALLSLYSDEEFEIYQAEMAAHDPQEWARLRPRVLAGITDCRSRGYSVSLGEWRSEILGVAAPLYRTEDGECLVVNCGMPSFRFSAEEVEHQFGPRISALAQSIRVLSVNE